MATYNSVARARHKTLTGASMDTVNFSTNFGWVEVKNRATTGAGISFTADSAASNPTVLGDDTYIVMPGEALTVQLEGSSDQVRLISTTSDDYSVTGVNG